MMGSKRWACVVLSLPLWTGCATTYHSPAKVALCETTDFKQWSRWGDGYRMKIDGIEYLLSFRDAQEGLSPTIAGSPVFWIEMSGLTSGQAVGSPSAPMMFAPDGARLHINGRGVPAMPRIWLGEFSGGRWRPTTEVAAPADLRTGGNDLPRLFLAFPIKPPAPGDDYTVELGTILLGGARHAIPIRASCQTPAKTWTEPFRPHIG